MLMRFARYSLAMLLLALAPVAAGQMAPTEGSGTQQSNDDVFSDELIFEGDLFNDDLFGDAFDGTEDSKEASWLDGFTLRLSQQLFWQVNNHSVEPLPGLRIPKDADLENNRLGLNFKYQNAFAPGWLLQSTGQARWYWKDDYEYQANDTALTSFTYSAVLASKASNLVAKPWSGARPSATQY
jgi:hypothetical protein